MERYVDRRLPDWATSSDTGGSWGAGTWTGAIPPVLSAVSLGMRRTRDASDGPSDEALLAGMAHGDEQAGLAFVRRYQGRVFGLALSMLGDPGLAEDVAQEALVRAWRHAPVYDPRRGAVSTWVLTIGRNLTIDALAHAPRASRPIPTT